MRFAALIVLASCSFTGPDSGSGTTTIVDDDFTRGTITDGVTTPWGRLEPAAFVVGGLFATAYDGNHVANNDTFEDVAAKVTTRFGASYRQNPVDHGNGRPRGLGLPRSDQFTVLYEGEIFLEIGVQKLELAADDRAVLELATDGVTFGRSVSAGPGAQSMTLDVRVAGWFPIRIAHGQAGGPSRVVLTSIVNIAREQIGATRLRARVTDHPGLVAFAFDTEVLGIPRGETAVPTVDANFELGAPAFDLDVGFEHFSLRHVGQLRVDAQATHEFSAEVEDDDWYRLWIDGVLVASTWNSTTTPSGTIDLAPGWHDVVFDYADPTLFGRVRLLMDGEPIESARFRPAVARGLVAIDLLLTGTIDIPDVGELVHPFAITAPPDGVIDFVDIGVGIRNHRITDLAVDLADCMAPQTLPVTTTNPLIERFYYFHSDARCTNTPVAPDPAWRLRLVDSQAGNDALLDPEIFTPLLVASYHGGEREPFARSVAFVSEPYETPDAGALVAARLVAEPAGGRVELSIRTAPDAATLEATPWTLIGDAGTLPAANALTQFQVVLGGDGWQYPTVDRVEIEYSLR